MSSIRQGQFSAPRAMTDRRLADEFDPRRNSFTFWRWVFAITVIYGHSFALGGFHGSLDPVDIWTHGQDYSGGIAVEAMFIMSGFLCTRSYFTSGNPVRFLWHRLLRIVPAFWVVLVISALVIAPIAWHHEFGTYAGAFSVRAGTVLGYLSHNFLLSMNQYDIGNLFANTPYHRLGGGVALDGSLWTLIYEAHLYIALAVLGVIGLLRSRRFVTVLTVVAYLFTVSYVINPAWEATLLPQLADLYIARFACLFGLGCLCWLYADQLIIDDRIGVAAVAVCVLTLRSGGWIPFGYPALAYTVIWLGVRTPIRNWGRFGDFSYGIYIWAFPFQMLFAEFGLQRSGLVVYFLASFAAAQLAGVASWHLVEKHALSLKSWTPQLPAWADRRPRSAWAPTRVSASASAAASVEPTPEAQLHASSSGGSAPGASG